MPMATRAIYTIYYPRKQRWYKPVVKLPQIYRITDIISPESYLIIQNYGKRCTGGQGFRF